MAYANFIRESKLRRLSHVAYLIKLLQDIREWENHWHRENNFTECFEYEKENEFDEYEYETAKQIFANEEAFRQYAMEKETQFVYQLPNNNMVVVVC